MSKIDRPSSSSRPNIRTLMVVIVMIASGLVLLKAPVPIVTSLCFTAAMTALMVAPLLAIYRRPRQFWLGFSIVGWVYALLAFAPGAWTEIRPYLFTSQLLDHAAVYFGYLEIGRPTSMLNPGASPASAGLSSWSVTNEGLNFQRIGHSLAALIHGAAGGLLANVLAGSTTRSAGRQAES